MITCAIFPPPPTQCSPFPIFFIRASMDVDVRPSPSPSGPPPLSSFRLAIKVLDTRLQFRGLVQTARNKGYFGNPRTPLPYSLTTGQPSRASMALSSSAKKSETPCPACSGCPSLVDPKFEKVSKLFGLCPSSSSYHTLTPLLPTERTLLEGRWSAVTPPTCRQRAESHGPGRPLSDQRVMMDGYHQTIPDP